MSTFFAEQHLGQDKANREGFLHGFFQITFTSVPVIRILLLSINFWTIGNWVETIKTGNRIRLSLCFTIKF